MFACPNLFFQSSKKFVHRCMMENPNLGGCWDFALWMRKFVFVFSHQLDALDLLLVKKLI